MTLKLAIIIAFSAFLLIQLGCKSQVEIAAEQGQALSQFKLGKMYFKGDGVPMDKVYAYMWANLAKSQGLGDTASKYLSEISTQMTTSEIEQAEKLTIECQEKVYKDC